VGSNKQTDAPTRKRAVVHGKGSWAGITRLAVNTFLIVHLIAITGWAIPLALVRTIARPYFVWSGLFQSWDMFSPTPKSLNVYVEAIVLYDDGYTRNWAFPRMELLDFRDRYLKERYRKFVENLNVDGNAALWPDAARFIARVNNNRPVPVKMVFLVRHWSAIIPWDEGSYFPMPWDAHVFFSQSISAGDLQ
jgi:hypothetical protein